MYERDPYELTHRCYSDLDLAIDAGRRLSLDELAEAFSDSDLPYKVDLIDWHNINDHCRQTITAERVPLNRGGKPRRAIAGTGNNLPDSAFCVRLNRGRKR